MIRTPAHPHGHTIQHESLPKFKRIVRIMRISLIFFKKIVISILLANNIDNTFG